MRRMIALIGGTVGLALLPALATASGPHVCRGTGHHPGVLSGRYPNGVTVTGLCVVNRGPARVIGTLDIEPGAAVLAAFGKHHSRLTVLGDVIVERGAALLLGCNTTSFPCVDDPAASNHKLKPTLTSPGKVTGDVSASGALGVIIHTTAVGGSVVESRGGGGASCNPPKTGPFGMFQSPVYSDYEDSTIGHTLSVSGVRSCWLGIARVHVANVFLNGNKFADPDAIEVLSNHISGELSCTGNTRLWDSVDEGNHLFPRVLERNHVGGEREGQCRRASRVKKGQRAKGPF